MTSTEAPDTGDRLADDPTGEAVADDPGGEAITDDPFATARSRPAVAPAPAPAGPSPTDRMTVTLLPRTGRELDRVTEETGMTRTDATNRALRLYAWVTQQIDAGRQFALIGDDDRPQPVHLL